MTRTQYQALQAQAQVNLAQMLAGADAEDERMHGYVHEQEPELSYANLSDGQLTLDEVQPHGADVAAQLRTLAKYRPSKMWN